MFELAHGFDDAWLDIGPIHAITFSFKNSAQPGVLVHNDKNRAVNEQIGRILPVFGFHGNGAEFQAVSRQPGRFPISCR